MFLGESVRFITRRMHVYVGVPRVKAAEAVSGNLRLDVLGNAVAYRAETARLSRGTNRFAFKRRGFEVHASLARFECPHKDIDVHRSFGMPCAY